MQSLHASKSITFDYVRYAQFIDSINFVRRLTLLKVVNAAKILVSYYISKILKRPVQWGKPLALAIEPTTACNLKCPECPSGLRSFSRATGNLKTDFFRETIDQVASTCCSLTMYFQGEPYINPKFLDMVKYANQKKLYTITSTNGHFLNDENARKTISSGLDRLIISLDGVTQETYAAYRREGVLEDVLSGVRNVVKWKRRLKSQHPLIILQFLVVRPNEHEIPELNRLSKELGVDQVRFKTAQIYDYHNGHPLIPTNESYSRYVRNNDGSYRLKYRLQNQCWKMWHSAVVTWDGLVVPCCFDKDAAHEMGNLRKETFHKIWKGEIYHHFRSRVLQNRGDIGICSNCTEGCSVWA